MNKILKQFARTLTDFFCILSLTAIISFHVCAYLLPETLMCRIYVFNLKCAVLLLSMLLLVLFAVDEAVWEDISNEKIKKTVTVFFISVLLTELVVFTLQGLCSISILFDSGLLFSVIFAIGFIICAVFKRTLIKKIDKLSEIHKKKGLRPAFAVLCITASLALVPQASDRIAIYNMYWEGAPQTPCSFEYIVNEDCTLHIENVDGYREEEYIALFDLIPDKVFEKFSDEGWTICIDSNYLAEYSWRKNSKRFGTLYYAVSDYKNKTIITHSLSPAILEIGRFCYNEFADKNDAERLFETEQKALLSKHSVGSDSDYFFINNAEDYFSFCFMKFISAKASDSKTVLQQVIPLTFDYLEQKFFNENNERIF